MKTRIWLYGKPPTFRRIGAALRWVIGRLIWFFIQPFAEDLCCQYTTDLIDRDELESETSNIQHDIRGLQRDIEELRAEE